MGGWVGIQQPPPPPPRSQGGERPMGAAYGGKGFEDRARVSGERPIGATRCRQQYNQVSCQRPPGRGSGSLVFPKICGGWSPPPRGGGGGGLSMTLKGGWRLQ